MAYRDELSALRERVRDLEEELDRVHEQRRGELKRERGNLWTGVPTRIRIERALDRTLDEQEIEDIFERLRDEFGQSGRIDRIGRTTVWVTRGSRAIEFRCLIRDGKTSMEIQERLAPLVGGLYGGIIGGAGGGCIGLIIALFVRFGALAVIAAIFAWLFIVFLFARTLFGSIARGRQRHLGALIDGIVAAELDAPGGERRALPGRRAVRVEQDPSVQDASPQELEPATDRAVVRRQRQP